MILKCLPIHSLATFCISIFFLLVRVTGELGNYNYYRLPTSLKPTLYNLNIITYLEPNNLKFRGYVTITLNVLQDTNNITLHATNLTVAQNRIMLKRHNELTFKHCVNSVKIVPYHDYYIIETCRTLRKNDKYLLKIFFEGVLNDQLRGYYRSSYVVKETKQKRYNFTQISLKFNFILYRLNFLLDGFR